MTVISTDQIRLYILSAVERDLNNAEDNLRRALRQQERMPFDHDNNDYVARKSVEVAVGRAAVHRVKELLG